MAAWTLLLTAVILATSSYAQEGLWNPSCNGRQVIVHLFEWKYSDIALECERFLAPAEFCGVQISPPQEHIHPPAEYSYPWWERYQPVSYHLHSRSGTEAELRDMVSRCNAVGVRIYADAVVNHMVGLGREGNGIDGSHFDSDAYDFPAVPYTVDDFTPSELCPSGDGNVNDYQDPNNIRNCNLVGLTDLYGASDYVRQMVSGYFNSLIDMGVAGFRIDAAKHMWPADIQAMIDLTHDLNTDHGFPASTRPFFFHEVIDQDDGAVTVNEYYDLGRVTEFRYCSKIKWGITDFGSLSGVYDPGWGMTDDSHALIFTDNHDNQRGHGGGGDFLTYKNPTDYRLGVAFTLAQPYGYTKIMSSYYFEDDETDEGPPHYSDYSISDVVINDQNECEGGWVCEHRWTSIYKMVRFRNAVAATTDWTNYVSSDSYVAFSRGNVGFFAMTKYTTLSQSFQTGMPAGTYEDIISCASVTVDSSGFAQVDISNLEEPVFAICQGCVCDSPPTVTATPGTDRTTTTTTTTPGPTEPSITVGIARTVIFVQKETNTGQDLFIRGGLDVSVSPGCSENDPSNDPCSIAITTNSLGTATHYAGYNAWRVGDDYLDWYGAESLQGSYGGAAAMGTPLAWTSSSSSNPGYQPLNVYGDHYWMVDMDMDCSQTTDGWFEFKAYLSNAGDGWEQDVTQDATCSGSAGGSTPYSSVNHIGRCGYVNVATFGTSECIVEQF